MSTRLRFVHRLAPLIGIATLAVVIMAVELLIEWDYISRYIVPLPSQIVASFERIIREEDVLGRFLLTAGEGLAAGILLTIVGIGGGIVLYRFRVLRLACETWIAALASAP